MQHKERAARQHGEDTMDTSTIRRTITVTVPVEQVRQSIQAPALLKNLGLESDAFELRQAPADRGTEVVLLQEVPTGAKRSALAEAAGKRLRLLKSLIETGETPTLAHNPSGRH